MGSRSDVATTVNLLEYLRSKTQVDADSLSIPFVTEMGPFVDCTSNQIDSYFELLKPERAALLKKAIALSQELHSEYSGVTVVELAVEIAMVSVSLTVAPLVTGVIHVMANPKLSYSTSGIIESGKRIASLCRRFEPSFDQSKLCIKVPSTWEGLQACRKLKSLGIQTLATTLFTLEQAILAAEVGCIYVSPFLHELKALLDETYHDSDPIFDTVITAQQYYEQHAYPTKVKACAVISVDEIMALAGVAAFTIAPNFVYELAKMHEPEKSAAARSRFNSQAKQQEIKRKDFSNESEYREAFAKNDAGNGEAKTKQAIDLFCGFQVKLEDLITSQDNALLAVNLS